MDLLQDMTNRLLTAEPMLKTSEEKKNVFASTPTAVPASPAVVCIMDAVTPDRKVATVVMSK